jgi:thermitase
MALRRLALALLTLALLAGAAPSAATAAPAYDDDTVIVKFKPGASVLQQLRVVRLPFVRAYVDQIRGVQASVLRVRTDPAVAAASIGALPSVEYAEPNYLLRATATPNDPSFSKEYGLHNTGQTGGTPDADIDAPEGWDAAGLSAFPSTGGVRVGIVDTGISSVHPDLAGKVVACGTSYNSGFLVTPGCEDDNGHGSHVAGTIAARTNNGQSVAGVAFNAPLVICKALATPLGTGLTSDIARCIEWTRSQGARIINMSLGGGQSETLKRVVQGAYAGGTGALLVAAAGNDGDATLNYPAAYPEVVSVAATDDDDRRASFSNANSDVEIAAPGDAVYSTFLGTTSTELSGTSMASPHVAGVAAVIAQRTPSANAAAIRSSLTSSVDDLGPAGRDATFGFGRANLCKAAGGSCAYTAASGG